MTLLPALPVLIPLTSAVASILLRRRPALQRAIALGGMLALLGTAAVLLVRAAGGEILVLHVGGWRPPFGITLAVDLLSALMVAVSAVIGVAVTVYSRAMAGPVQERRGYYPLLHVLLMGVCGAFVTGDVFNLYVWFEVMLIASFVLMGLEGGKDQLEASLKYVVLNLIASAFFLVAAGILYGAAGTLNMADLAVKLRAAGGTGLTSAVAMLFLVAFGIKAALFPFFFWLPASYHTAPPATAALFAGLLTKVGVYAILRFFTLLFEKGTVWEPDLIALLAGLTMVTGVMGAVTQGDFRRILSFHIISQIGYMVMGLALYTAAGLAGSIFYVVHHIIVKTNLFLIGGVVGRRGGSFALARLGGLWTSAPLLSLLFLVPALSLAGLPPLSGFFAKLALVKAGLSSGAVALTAAALGTGLLTLFSMAKIWNEAFWKPAPPPEAGRPLPARGGDDAVPIGAILVLAALTVGLGLGGSALLGLSEEAAGQLLDPSSYIRAVLEKGGPR